MVRQFDARALARELKSRPDGIVLLDVREADERAVAAIEPSLFIPMAEVPHRLAEIPRDRPVVVYCHSGTRSMMVAGYLEREGFGSVGNLRGGIDGWAEDVEPSMARY